MNKKRIVMIEIAGKGGICHYTYNLANALGSEREIVLVTGKNYELKNKKKTFVVQEMFNRLKTNPFFLLGFLKLVREKDVTVCHFQLSQYPVFVLILILAVRLFSRRKVVVTAHNVISHESKKCETFIYNRIYALADKIIIHAEANKRELLEYFPCAKDKIEVIPHGNYMFFSESVDNAANIGDYSHGTKNILFFGYIREYKGLMHLIRALKKVIEKVPDAKLLIVGKPVESFQKYQDEINRLRLEKNIELELGYIPFDEVNNYLRKSAIMVLPYEKIYQSGVLQLAYGFGLPVVVTDTGGMPEVVEDGVNGKVVPVANPEALAEAIVQILSDNVLRESMGKRSLELAKTKFSWESIAELSKNLYATLEA